MSSKYVKNIVTAIAFVIMLFIGYIRETIFLVLNSVLYDYPFPYNRSYTEPPAFLMEWSDQTIVNVKWLLTFGFSVLFMFLTALIIRFYFKNKRFSLLTVLLYVSIICFSGLLIVVGYGLNINKTMYPIARFLMGMVQYPLFSLVLFCLFYFSNKSIKKGD